ncbi:MAG: glutamyl-tRNA reductase [Thermobacillus sp. ZCTH02-B1]|uniref:glutamyl-tRNA reductase n=1 Tax=Thermobacillus sp. ZCTH02-B1 TaxID=1858795 RepID=UPI000B562C8E|nr:glutamyl-tRNA reductase [Thermobacillus sp. ZCTH02-B1]OUM96108.1 MAG: glutamyl-tRNA reductase [Thermobacillus sp. ZCTH02-B1]
MHILVVGLNYRTAPVEVRERFTFAGQELPKALEMLKRTTSVMECVIIATCNRTELYAVVDRHVLCGHYIRHFMEQWFGVPRETFTKYLYMYEDEAAIRHLFRVACGLDSMILGETQILGQVRDAFLLAQREGATGTLFNMLFRQAITVGKRAHTETSIGENAVSVSYAAVELGKRIFGGFGGKTALVIGAGKMGELTAKHLNASGIKRVLVANRTYERAVEFAARLGGEPIGLAGAAERLAEADVVISSTGSREYVLTKAQVEQAMRLRPSRPLFLIDIAVPRDLDPAIADIPNVFLYDIDDLEGIVESNLEQRRREAVKIEAMIGEELAHFLNWYRTLGVVPLIRALQEKAARIHEETMTSLFNKLPDLTEHERRVIRKMTKRIVNQLMHDPILRIKEMAADRKAGEAMDLFVKLFALEEEIRNLKKETEAKEAEARTDKRSDATEQVRKAAGGLAAVTP